MIAFNDLVSIVAIALGCAAAVGLVGLIVLLSIRRRSLLLQVCVIVLAVVASTVMGFIAVANAMYLSEHDLTVVFYVAGAAGLISLALAIGLGLLLTASARRLVGLTRALSYQVPTAITVNCLCPGWTNTALLNWGGSDGAAAPKS